MKLNLPSAVNDDPGCSSLDVVYEVKQLASTVNITFFSGGPCLAHTDCVSRNQQLN